MVIGLENLVSGFKNDDNFFRMVAKTAETVDNVYVYTYYPMYKCTEMDYEKFEKTDEQIDKKFQKMKQLNTLYCTDFDAHTLDLYGTWTTGDYMALDLMVIPCG